MTGNPAIRLVSDTLHADTGGISTAPGNRQLVIDGPASLRLRREIGNDCYNVLEVLFILAEPSPTGVVIHSATEKLQDALSWGRDKIRRTLRDLQDKGFIHRTQEATTDSSGKLIFGRGVLSLNISAVDVVPEQDLHTQDTQPDGWGVWGRPLDAEVCKQMLATWGVRGTERLLEQDHTLVSDAIKFVQNALRTGIPIENPGAYTRKLITNRRVAAPDPSVPPELLSEELTFADLIGSLPEQRQSTVERARAAKQSRRKYLDSLLRTGVPDEVREEVLMLVDDDMREFAFTSEEVREVHRYHMIEERLAERGLLFQLPGSDSNDDSTRSEDPPF